MAFRGGFQGILEHLRFFMDYFPDPSKYVGNLVFQGSNYPFWTNLEIVDILTIGEEIHEGWNDYSLAVEQEDGEIIAPRFAYYRLYNPVLDGCDSVGEVMMIGIQVITSTDPAVGCKAEIVQPEDFACLEEVLWSGEQWIVYDLTVTPYIESISPRWGTVEGGTEVTFSGARLSTVPSDYSILLDGIACEVTVAAVDSVKCITGPRTGIYEADPTLEIFIENVGYVGT